MKSKALWTILVSACTASDPSVEPRIAPPPIHQQVVVNNDGTFSPDTITVHEGDIVDWILADRTDAVIPVEWDGVDTCSESVVKAYSTLGITGPRPVAASGIFVMAPSGRGLVEEDYAGMPLPPTCADGSPPKASAGTKLLCESGTAYETMSATWEDPAITGVFISIPWSAIETENDVFYWEDLDREVKAAVEHGKLYSLAFAAGKKGTPSWIFSDARPAIPVTGLRDGASELDEETSCGFRVDPLGNPSDANYRAHYVEFLAAVGAHLSERADWFRALAYVKPAGANMITDENRLPKRCNDLDADGDGQYDCPCNTQIWAEAGYTPDGLVEFYAEELEVIADAFPGKTTSFQLIQAGFPRVNNAGDYLTRDGTSSGGLLPGAYEQTVDIMNRGAADHGLQFAVQHNGLGPKPDPATQICAQEGVHPKTGNVSGFDERGCPNPWALAEGADGQITGFQTQNANGVGDAVQLEATLQNAWDNSDAIFVEIYEQRRWELEETNTGVLPSGRTLGQWADDFHQRRHDDSPGNAIYDPFPVGGNPGVYTHRFVGTLPTTLTYVNPAKCVPGITTYGTIIVQ